MRRTIEVLLREDIRDLGRCGDVVKVAAGHARNYLMPRRLAVEATEDNRRAMQRRRTRLDAEAAVLATEARQRAERLAGVELRTGGRADEAGHLFGSVNAARIAELLAAAGHGFREQDVRLETPLKTVGTHVVRVHVHGEVFAEVRVTVEAE